VLRRIFELRRNEMTRGWRKLHNEELHNFYTKPDIIRTIKPRSEIDRTCSTHGEKRNPYRILVGKSDGETPLGSGRGRWNNNIKKVKVKISLLQAMEAHRVARG
jgi:hypothetical protein